MMTTTYGVARNQKMKATAPIDGFAFFSGLMKGSPGGTGWPCIYRGSGSRFRVCGPGFFREFREDQFDEAMAAYRDCLREADDRLGRDDEGVPF